ncbi:MAG: HAD family hydrolase [Candidatus Thorarchaeota archaeon]
MDRAVIFDFDGTLVDTMGSFYEMVITNLNQHGIIVSESTINRLGTDLIAEFHSRSQSNGAALILRLFWNIGRKAGLSRYRSLRFAMKCAVQARDVYKSAPLFSDVRSTLKRLQNEGGFKLGIYTLAPRKILLNTLETHDLIQYFSKEGIISRDDVQNLKPDPEGVFLALEGCSVPASYSVLIGDMPADILAGTAAGLTTIGLTTGLISREIFQQFSRPTKIFDSLEQASQWILESYLVENGDSVNQHA